MPGGRCAPVLGAILARLQNRSIRTEKSVHTPAYRQLIELLVKARDEAGLSQRALAAKLGCHPSWVAKVEMGERRLDVVEFVRVCRALGRDPLPIVRKVAAAI